MGFFCQKIVFAFLDIFIDTHTLSREFLFKLYNFSGLNLIKTGLKIKFIFNFLLKQ